MQGQGTVRTSLQGIAKKAESQKDYRFRNLYGMLNEELLRDSWRMIRKEAAYGVDKVGALEYEKELDENIDQLVERLKGKRYHAKLVRRKYIPKGKGKVRPLGILVTEDKLLQLAAKRILEAIYEQDFLRCSYGYRPKVGPLNAVDKLTVKLQFGKYNYLVEADIQGFFDNLSHEWMVRMLEERIDDRPFVRLIQKWLKAGVLESDGKVILPQTGTPQGGIVSPVLANVYLHYVLDVWFHKVVAPRCRGEACLIRYADDFVCAFERQEDAQRFFEALGPRLGKFGLALSAEKTRVIPFSQHISPGKTSFDFLGFEFRWGKDRKGQPHVTRRTAPKKLKSSLKNVKIWCRENRHLRLKDLFNRLNAKLRGYYNYFGVIGNSASLQLFFYKVLKILRRYLNQRSQRQSYNWAGFLQLIEQHHIEKPRIIGRPLTSRAPSVA